MSGTTCSTSFELRFAPAQAPIALAFARRPSVEAEFAAAYIGPVGNADGAFLVVNRLAELDTEPARHTARENLGLAVIDGGTFF